MRRLKTKKYQHIIPDQREVLMYRIIAYDTPHGVLFYVEKKYLLFWKEVGYGFSREEAVDIMNNKNGTKPQFKKEPVDIYDNNGNLLYSYYEKSR